MRHGNLGGMVDVPARPTLTPAEGASAPSALAVAAAVRRGELELMAYVDEVCARIDAVDPGLHAFVDEPDRRGRVRAEARALLDRWPDPDDRPPLFGVPLGVKDVLHVDGLPTLAGSRLSAGTLAGSEATAVTRLRDAGALVMGKTVTAEFAFMAPGPTRNPRDRDHSPGGSSSGSAAAVAAGLVVLALGTQTVGSVIRPAAYCGIAGLKPTYARSPSDGLIANAPTFDTVGLFASDVAGLALAGAVLCDGWRPAAADDLPVLGVPDGPYLEQAEPEARAAFEARVATLEATGYDVRRTPALADIAAVNERNGLINLVELARTHEQLFAAHADLYRDQTAAAIREGRQVSVEAYEGALADRAHFAAGLVDLMDGAGIDAWITPAATGPAPRGITTTGSPLMNLPWTQARLPVVTVPAGRARSSGLPLGLQCVARPGADEALLTWATSLAMDADAGVPPA
ncbi:MAG TPA: amidase [Actinopolymorphaceae bacterium]|nr:amidase [Actinopolymorphaceae bacterium]